MSETHDMAFGELAIVMAKHQGLELDDQQLFLLLNIEAKLPEILAASMKEPLRLQAADIEKLKNLQIKPTLETSNDELQANGEILKRLIALLEQILPLIIPLFVKKA